MKAKEFYINRLQQVVSYLRNRYNEKILIEDLEELSNFSYRNLQRIFKAEYKETIGTYVIRLKVENSAKMLVFTSDKIKDIAEKVGYADVQSYSKSFKKHYGISPAIYRNKKEELFKKETKENTNTFFFEDKIVVLKSKKVLYKTVKANYYKSEIEEVWDKLLKEAEDLHINFNKTESFGIIWDEPIISENITFNYDACLVIDDTVEIPDKKFKVKTIPEQKYAVFIHTGSYQSISKTYDKIFKDWLFTTHNEVSEHPFLEFYTKHEAHTDNENEYETEIYVPLKG